MKKYLMVTWHHDRADEPVTLYHELDDAHRESRRIERFRDGTLRWADRVNPEAEASLSIEPLPSLDEIAGQPEFTVQVIDQQGFEAMWAKARQMYQRPRRE